MREKTNKANKATPRGEYQATPSGEARQGTLYRGRVQRARAVLPVRRASGGEREPAESAPRADESAGSDRYTSRRKMMRLFYAASALLWLGLSGARDFGLWWVAGWAGAYLALIAGGYLWWVLRCRAV